MRLQGKTAIVTGGARGLGRAYALRLAKLGANVAVVDIDLGAAAAFGEQLTEASVAAEVERFGVRALSVEADLMKRSETERVVTTVVQTLGAVDILVNNAGGGLTPVERSKASQAPDEDIQRMFDLNFLSTLLCCQAVVPVMRKQGSGVVVNTSSVTACSVYGEGIMSLYATAKAAVAHYTRYLAAEVGPHGVRANCISPGVVLTSRVVATTAKRGIGTAGEAAHIPLRRLATVEDCAGVLEFLATDLSQYVTGQVISGCGGAVLSPS